MGQALETASAAAGIEAVVAAGAPASFVELTGANNPFGGIVEVDKAPALLDVDGDGDLDLVLGQFYTDPLLYFRNNAGSYVQQTGVANPFNPISFSGDAAPTPIDIDGDGDLDLLVGWELGLVKIMLNHGGGIWGSGGNISGINTIGYSTPVAIDIDGDGRQDIVSGNLDGRFQSYHNNGDGSFTELTGAANPLDGIDAGTFSAIGFIDVDGDRDLDAVVSSLNGTVAVYADNGNRTFVPSATNPFSGLGLDGDGAKFSFTDIDADGDLDAVVGLSAIDSPIRVFQQTGAPTGVVGTAGNNSLGGTAGNDTIDGRGGADTMTGGLGDDTYYVDSTFDQVVEGAGQGTADRIYASVSYTLGAGVQVEILATNNAAETGAIALTGNELANSIVGNAGANMLRGRAGSDTLDGGGGNDRLIGDADADTLIGGDGNDVLNGGAGNDTMSGGAGDDIYVVRDDNDVVTEAAGAGIDVVRSQIDFTIGDNVEELYIGGAARNGAGNTLNNTLYGSGGGDTLWGFTGDDTLRGNEGRDTLLGGDGADLLDGGAGKDTLTGGIGRDVFQFRDGDMGVNRSLADEITDFSHASGEKIGLSLVDADTTLAGNQAFTWLGTGAFTGAAGELHYAIQAGNTYVEGDTNGDGVADFSIRLVGLVNLVGTDFVL